MLYSLYIYYIIIYIYIYIYIWSILLWNIQTEYERRKSGYYKSGNFTASFVKVHAIANSCRSVTFFANFFICWYKSQSFVFQKMNSKHFCSFDNFNSLLWGYYFFRFWLLLALKLTIRIKVRGDVVGINWSGGGGWKNFAKLIMWSLCYWYEKVLLLRFKMLCYVLFQKIFRRICLNLYATFFMVLPGS